MTRCLEDGKFDSIVFGSLFSFERKLLVDFTKYTEERDSVSFERPETFYLKIRADKLFSKKYKKRVDKLIEYLHHDTKINIIKFSSADMRYIDATDTKLIHEINNFLSQLPEKITRVDFSGFCIFHGSYPGPDERFSLIIPDHITDLRISVSHHSVPCKIVETYFSDFFDRLPISLEVLYFKNNLIYKPHLKNLPPMLKIIVFNLDIRMCDDILKHITITSSIELIAYTDIDTYVRSEGTKQDKLYATCVSF